MSAWRTAAAFTLALAATAGVAAAQGQCAIDSGGVEVRSAAIYLSKARSGKLDEQPGHLKNAVRVLSTNGDRIKNQIGRQWLLAQAFVEYQRRPGAQMVVKRGDLGYTDKMNDQVDILAAIDTALTAVEAARPDCRAETDRMRRPLWGSQINQAIAQMNNDELDSAQFYLHRANLLNPTAPLGAYVAASIAQKKNDQKGAAEAYQRTATAITPEVAGRDTSLVKIRQQSVYNAGVLYQQLAEAATDDATKKQYSSLAQDFYRTYLKDYPQGQSAAQSATNLARLLGSSGNTASIDSLYAGMLADPSKYTDIQLFEGGTGLFAVKKYQDAARMFELGLGKNASYRDALYNLTNTYMALEDYAKMQETARRLVSVDPNNPASWSLLAASFQRMSSKLATSDPKKRALTDSVVKYIQKRDATNPKLTGLLLQHNGANHTLTGQVENTGSAAGNYTINFEFLDSTGKVVASKQAQVSVPAGGNAPIKVDVTQAGIVAFRYAPIS